MAECIREAGFHTELAEDPRGCLAVPNSQRAAFLGTKEGLLLGTFNTILFSIVAAPIYIPSSNVHGSLFSTFMPILVICCLSDNS